MLHGETIHSPLPQDIPWWSPDFAVFFGVLYLVLFVIGTGVGYVILRSICIHFAICFSSAAMKAFRFFNVAAFFSSAVATVRSTRRKVIRACLFSESRLSSPFCLQAGCFLSPSLESISQRGGDDQCPESF